MAICYYSSNDYGLPSCDCVIMIMIRGGYFSSDTCSVQHNSDYCAATVLLLPVAQLFLGSGYLYGPVQIHKRRALCFFYSVLDYPFALFPVLRSVMK